MRYLTLEKFVSLLELEAMWFSRLGALQDRFEGTLPKKARDRLLNRDRDIAGNFPEPRLRPAIMQMTERDVEVCRGLAAVNCWFLGQQESEKMWREYGQGGTGVTIRSTVKRLATSFQITGDYALASEIGRVQYVDFESHDFADVEELESINGKAFLKEKSFSSEQEVRVMILNCLHSGCLNPDGTPVSASQFAVCGPTDPNRDGFYVRCRLPELIQAVVVGPHARSHFFTLIKRLVSRYRLFVPVEKSHIIPKS